jgi:assimilatory nitrate reductase catalytic subunit
MNGSLSEKVVSAARELRSLVHQRSGNLTDKLERVPGGFGLGQVPARLSPDAVTTMVCGFCSTGCGLKIHLNQGEAVNLTPDPEYPVNCGVACPKGWEALRVLKADDRATTPLVGNRGGRQRPVDWDTAMQAFCRRFKAIQQAHGPHAIAVLSSGQIATEEMALLGCLVRFGMGLRHIDSNTRQCMATAATAYKQSFGFDAPPYTYDDFEQSDLIVLVGSNLCVAHPILWERICRNPYRPQIVVVDPRKTETAMAANLHLAIQPKSDLVFFYGLAHILIREGWIDRDYIAAHTEGFEEFCWHVEQFTPDVVARQCGIEQSALYWLAMLIHKGKRVSFWWTMGVNQSYEGTRTAQSLINLALITGNMGRPGTGANSVTGQCNAMGSRLFANATSLLGGHDFEKPEDRGKIARILDIDPDCIPDQNSWAYHEIVEGILSGQILGLWIIGTNPAHSWINQNMLSDVLGRLDYLVVQDMYTTTETARRADLILPAAAWGEKEGTFINSERRIGVIKKVSKAPGEALTDFSIFRLIAEYWGCGEMFRAWSEPEAAFQILKEVSRGLPCDISGVADYRMLDDCGGIQWPYPEGATDTAQHRRLFADGRFYHKSGRAKILFDSPRRMPEAPSERYPFLLLTGRGSAAQWHTQTRTAKSPVLRQLAPAEVYVEVNPEDAARENIRPNQVVLVESQRGSIRAKAFLTYAVQAGHVFIPMHYDVTNQLTLAHFDPYSKQPSYKDCAVRIRSLQEKGGDV